MCRFQAVLLLKQLIAGLSLWKPGSVHVGFVVDKVALGQVFLQVLQFWSIPFHVGSILIYNRPIIGCSSQK
jgi:hypothetical protein